MHFGSMTLVCLSVSELPVIQFRVTSPPLTRSYKQIWKISPFWDKNSPMAKKWLRDDCASFNILF